MQHLGIEVKLITMSWKNLNWAQHILISDDLTERFKLDFEIFRKPFLSDLGANLVVKFSLKKANAANFSPPTFEIKACFLWDVEKFNIISKDLYDIFLNLKNNYQGVFNKLNDSNNSNNIKLSLYLVADSYLENDRKLFDLDFSTIGEQAAILQFESFSGFQVQLRSEGNYQDEPALNGTLPRVQVSYIPNTFPETWSRDSLKIVVSSEAPNGKFFPYDVQKKILEITCGMIQQKVYELPLGINKNLNYEVCYSPLSELPIQNQIRGYLKGLFSNYFNQYTTVYEFLNHIESEQSILRYLANDVSQDKVLTMRILANIRASFLTLALSKGKLIRMYSRTNFLDNIQGSGLSSPKIKPVEEIIAEPFLDILGTGESGLTVVIYSNYERVNTAKVDTNGNWVARINLKNGNNQIQASQICPNGTEIRSNAVNTIVRAIPKNLCDQLDPDVFIHDLICLNAYLRYLLMKFDLMTVKNLFADKDVFEKIGEKNYADIIGLLDQKQSV